MNQPTGFGRYIGINYSGAETPDAQLRSLRVYAAEAVSEPVEVAPPDKKKNWTRESIAEWLATVFSGDVPAFVGLNHAFSFPLAYFVQYRLSPDWRAFLDDFCHHWPTGESHIYVDFVLEGVYGNAAARWGNRAWRRLTERSAGHRSVFHYQGPHSVAKATHAGLPWLRFLDRAANGKLHFWPFDGWCCPAGKSMIAEVDPALCMTQRPRAERNHHQHVAYSIAAWVQYLDRSGTLSAVTQPDRAAETERIARIEGWMLGLTTRAKQRGMNEPVG